MCAFAGFRWGLALLSQAGTLYTRTHFYERTDLTSNSYTTDNGTYVQA